MICPSELASAVFLAMSILAIVRCSIRPLLNTLAVLFIFKPVTFISGAIYMSVNSLAVCFIIFPLSFINIAISVNKPTSAVCFIVFPITFVARTIKPDLDAFAISDVGISNPIEH